MACLKITSAPFMACPKFDSTPSMARLKIATTHCMACLKLTSAISDDLFQKYLNNLKCAPPLVE
jgi:hypothetical protein